MIKESEMQPFYPYGRLIAVLEQGARARARFPGWNSTTPGASCPGSASRALQKHLQSVLPFLERRGRSERYITQINSLANTLQNSEEPPQDPEASTAGAPVTCPTTAAESPNFPQLHAQGRTAVRPGLPG